MSTDKTIRELMSSSILSELTSRPGPDIRPCLASLLETSLCKGDYPGRSGAVVALTAELLRLGKDQQEIEAIIEEWNRSNSPPLSSSEIQRAIKSGMLDKYEYSCEHQVLASFCIGLDCPYSKRKKNGHKKVRNFKFLDYRWPQILTHRQVLLYFAAVPYLEVKHKIGPGGRLFASHRQLAEIAGISVKRVGEDLQRLAQVGLITYTPGIPRKWERQASRIQRVIPIPPPRPTSITKGKRP